jgi:hypothetical protein
LRDPVFALPSHSHKKGFRSVEVGVAHYPRLSDAPTGVKPAVILRAFWELFGLYRTLKF